MLEAKISRAKAKLLVDYPYFGTLASRLEFSANENVEAFLTDGTRFEYNADYLDGLEMDELAFALSNGAMHAALAHDSRKKGRMGWLWQLATDYAINAMLVENGLEAPERINYDERFEGMYAEEIYALLKDEIKNEEFDGNEENDTGFNENNKRRQNEMHAPDQEQAKAQNRPKIEAEEEHRKADEGRLSEEEQWQRIGEEALQKALKRGDKPLGIERFVEIAPEGRVDWRSELRNAVDRHYLSDYRLLPPSKKLLYMGTYLPSTHSDTLRVVIAIDSSGSVDEALLGKFLGEIEALMLSFPNYLIDLLVCDAAVHEHRSFTGGERIEYRLKGGGGTDFRSVFAYVDSVLDGCELLLYFTDLDGRFPDEEPLYETLWVCDARHSGPVPFGRVVPMEEDT